ncbi:hypothetical protein VCR17J2_50003 [Vibrio coralliirubri]|nr:hypothetical protein VCR17J2_50003 [Vibrio coralliirubri]
MSNPHSDHNQIAFIFDRIYTSFPTARYERDRESETANDEENTEFSHCYFSE